VAVTAMIVEAWIVRIVRPAQPFQMTSRVKSSIRASVAICAPLPLKRQPWCHVIS
jgi:hypothetical protein